MSRSLDQTPTFYSDVFTVQEYDPDLPLGVGSLDVGLVPVLHIPHTYGMRVRGAALFAYSADSGPCEGLAEIAHESDLFLCECANVEGSTYPAHLTPRQAGSIAQRAGAHRLLLTHRWWAYGQEETVAQARETYVGPVELAYEDLQVTLAP